MQIIKQNGFTLVEIMIVVAIVGLLASAGIPSILNAYTASQDNAKARNLADVEKAKGMLQLPETVYSNGKNLEIGDAVDESDLVACMEGVEALSELDIGDETIIHGAIGEAAIYESSSSSIPTQPTEPTKPRPR